MNPDGRSSSSSSGTETTTERLLGLAVHIQFFDPLADTDLATSTLAATTNADERSAANLVLGIKHREAGNLAACEEFLRSCLSENTADLTIITLGRLRLVELLVLMGRFADADETLTAVEAHHNGTEAAEIAAVRAFVASIQEQKALALTHWRRAIEMANDDGNELLEMLSRCGYGADLIQTNRLDEAEFQSRQVLLAQPSSGRIQAQALHNLGRLLALKGEIAESLQRIEQCADLSDDRAWTQCRIAITRTEALLGCRLLDEAERAAAKAIELANEIPGTATLAEALILSARVAIAARQLAPAMRDITAARRLFDDEGRSLSAERTRQLLHALDPTHPHDFPLDAILSDTSLIEALYLTIDRCEREEDTLPILRTIAQAAQSESVRQRALGLSAAAQLALLDGRITKAHELIDELLEAGHRMCDGIGSVEMRSTVFFDLTGVEFIAVALARHDTPERAFQLMDTVASRIHRDRTATALETGFLDQLTSLREATRLAPVSGDSAAATHQDNPEYSALERRIRFLSRRTAASADSTLPQDRWLDRQIPTASTVSFLVASETVWRCSTDGGTAKLAPLGPLAAIDRLLRRLRFAFDLALDARPLELDIDAVQRSGDALYSLLMNDMPTDGTQLTFRLHRYLTDVPWRLLCPGPSDRASVNPGVPHHTHTTPMPTLERVTIIVGPDLGQPALDEAAAIAAIHPKAVVLSGERATVDRTLEAFEQSDLVHIVGHGTPHANDPLLTNVQLHDGPLTAYDLEGLLTAPSVVVLASCGLGASCAPGQASAYGLPGVLLQRGSLAVIGSPMWIDNGLTSLIMPDLHRSLADGHTPVEALALLPNGEGKRDLTAQSVISMQSGPLAHRDSVA